MTVGTSRFGVSIFLYALHSEFYVNAFSFNLNAGGGYVTMPDLASEGLINIDPIAFDDSFFSESPLLPFSPLFPPFFFSLPFLLVPFPTTDMIRARQPCVKFDHSSLNSV